MGNPAGENPQEKIQKKLDAGDTTVTERDVEKAYNKAAKTASFLELPFLIERKNQQLAQIDKLSKQHTAGAEAISNNTKEILKIEKQQQELRNKIPEPNYETFPTGNSIKDTAIRNAPATLIENKIDKKLEEYEAVLEKTGLNTEANRKTLKEALLKLLDNLKKNGSLDLGATQEAITENLKTFLKNLDGIYENNGGKAVFPKPLDMLIHFSGYTKIKVIGPNGELNKEELIKFLQYSNGTLTSYLNNYRQYIALEEEKKTLNKAPEATKKPQPAESETPSVKPPPDTDHAAQKQEKPINTPANPPQTPPQTPPASPGEKAPDMQSSLQNAILQPILDWLSTILPAGIIASIAGWLGLKYAKALNPEIVALTNNLAGLSETEKDAFRGITEALLDMAPFKEGQGKTNLMAHLKILTTKPDEIKTILGKKEPSKSWTEHLAAIIDKERSDKLGGSTALSASEIAAILTPKPNPTAPKTV